MSNPRQLSLPVYLPDDETFDSFYPGDNEQILALLSRLTAADNNSFVYLWGAPKSGKTHLLHACCAAAQNRGLSSFYIPFEVYATMACAYCAITNE